MKYGVLFLEKVVIGGIRMEKKSELYRDSCYEITKDSDSDVLIVSEFATDINNNISKILSFTLDYCSNEADCITYLIDKIKSRGRIKE